MTIYNFPDISPEQADFGLTYNVQLFESELTADVHQRALSGDRWTVSMTFAHLTDDQWRVMQGFLNRQRGGLNRFRMSPPWLKQAGSLQGVPSVNSAGQTGTTLNVSGFDALDVPLRAGDYFEVNGELKQVFADVVTDGTGTATIDFEPPLRRSPPSGALLEMVAPTAVFVIPDPSMAIMSANNPIVKSATIAAIEDVNQ